MVQRISSDDDDDQPLSAKKKWGSRGRRKVGFFLQALSFLGVLSMRIAMDEMLTKNVGRKVEVCYKENGFERIWYKAILEATPLTIHRSKHREFCVRLLKDDYATPFTKLSNNVLVRPVPPVHVEARIDVKEGCVVDASRKDEWWIGLVIKLIEKDKCLVFFDSPPDIVQFERKDLRPHLYWVDEKYWVVRGSYLEVIEIGGSLLCVIGLKLFLDLLNLVVLQ